MIRFLGQAYFRAKYFAAQFLHGVEATPPATGGYSGSGVGGGTTGHPSAARRKDWLQLTAERSRRYNELFQELLEKERKLEEVEQTKLTFAKKQVRKLQLKRAITRILRAIERIEIAAQQEEEHLMLAFLLD